MKGIPQQAQGEGSVDVPDSYRIEPYDGKWYAEYLDIWENWQPFRVVFDDSVLDFSTWPKALKHIQKHISSGAEAKRKAREEHYKADGTLPKLPYHELSQWLGKLRLHERYPIASAISLHDKVISIQYRYGAYYQRILEPKAQYETPGLPLPLETILSEIAHDVEHFGAKLVLNETLNAVKQQRHAYYVELMQPLPCTCVVCGEQNLTNFIMVGKNVYCQKDSPLKSSIQQSN